MSKLEPYEPTAQDLPHDYHAAISITWAELEDAGLIDWSADEWQWDYYSEAQRDRLQQKISARFEFREIGMLPFAVWRRQFIRKLNEIMPKYSILYEKLEDGFDPWQIADDYGKSRDIRSDFPATLINGENQDYASDGSDHEHEEIHLGDTAEKLEWVWKRYNDIDVMILDELEPLFSGLITVNLNGF